MHGPDSLWVDGAVAAVVILSTIFAVLRGLVREVLSILAWACAVAVAIWLGPSVGLMLRGHISTSFVAPVLAYGGVFLLVFLPLAFASARIVHSVRQSPIGTIDRCMGVPFGFARGLLIVGLAYLAITLVVPYGAQPTWMTHARLMPIVRGSSEMISALLPDFGHAFADMRDVPTAHVGDAVRKTDSVADRRALDHLIAKTNAAGGGRP
ncbi:MAG TPA: CvpA family protein [Rhizomicrobium sp.]|jgi:membrane protein required for colicin V production